MQKRSQFLVLAIFVGIIATVIGGAMILNSGGGSGDGASSLDAAAAQVQTTGGQAEKDSFTGDSALTFGSADTHGEAPAPGAAGAVSGVTSQSSGGTTSDTNAIVDRKIERQATIDVTVDDVAGSVTRIEAAASAVGGYVSQSTITQQTVTGDDGQDTKRQQATVQIRVPADKYESVIGGLRDIAKEVTSEQSQTTEVTGQYVDLQAQLHNLQATEQQYLGLMGQAQNVNDILALQDRLTSVQGQIDQIQGQINLLDNLSDMATITVNVTLPPIIGPQTPKPGEQNWAEEALTNAWHASEDVLQFMGVAAITAGVVLVWVLVPGVLLLAGWRLLGGGRKDKGQTAAP